MVETDGRAQLEKLEYPKECKQCPRRATKSFLLLLQSLEFPCRHMAHLRPRNCLLKYQVFPRGHADARFYRERHNELVVPGNRHGAGNPRSSSFIRRENGIYGSTRNTFPARVETLHGRPVSSHGSTFELSLLNTCRALEDFT